MQNIKSSFYNRCTCSSPYWVYGTDTIHPFWDATNSRTRRLRLAGSRSHTSGSFSASALTSV